MSKVTIITAGLLLLGSGIALAQQRPYASDTTIKSSTIEISQIYQPQIKQAVKAEYNPSLPAISTSPANFSYEVPPHALNYSYKPLPLQALSIGRDTVYKGYDNYIKLGLGNLRTLFLDAGIGGLKARNFNSFFHVGLLSQKGSLAYQKQTLAALSGEGQYQRKNLKAVFHLDAQHDNFFQYGYDEVAMPNKVPTRQTLSGGKFRADLSEIEEGAKGFRTDGFALVSLYSGNNISSETSLGMGLGIQKKMGDFWHASLGLRAMATSLKSELYSVNNNYAGVNVGVAFDQQNVAFHAYLKPTIGQNNNSYLLPDLLLRFRIPKIQTIISAGLEGKLVQNTYQQLFQNNPYISSFTSQQMHSNEVFASIEKGVGHHFSLTAKLSWWQYQNLPLYLNQLLDREKMFVLYQDQVNAISLQFGARYQIANTISVGGQLSLFKYSNLGFNSKVWHTPTTKLQADLLWMPMSKLSVTAYANYLGGNYALDADLNTIKLNPIVDLGFGLEYEALKKVALFLNCNNLLNNKYQRWQGYQSYGINIYGGVRLKF